MHRRSLCFALLLIFVSIRISTAAFSYSTAGSTYTQNFDSLASSGTAQEWNNDLTLNGWHLYRVTAGSSSTPYPMSLYDASDGSADNGRFYSLGTGSDRALGGVGHAIFGYSGDRATSILINAAAGWIAASFTNTTGSALSAFTVTFDGEQWRDAGDNEPPYPQTMEFQYGFGDTFSTVGTWTSPGGTFDFTSPVFTTTNQPIDGNGIGRVANRGGTISNLSWTEGKTLWFRWVDRNDLAFDHAMAIDNFSFTAAANAVSAVPEAGTGTIYGVICCVIALAWARRAILEFFFSDSFARRLKRV